MMKKLMTLALSVVLATVARGHETEVVDGVTWHFEQEVVGGKLVSAITSGDDTGGYSGNLTVPAALGGHPVTRIGEGAFANCTGLTSVELPPGVTHVDDSAFANCTGLTAVTLPGGITRLSPQAFAGCDSVETVTLGGTLLDADVIVEEGKPLGDWTDLTNGQYRSKKISDDQSSQMSLVLNVPVTQTAAFRWMTSSEEDYDILEWSLDGVRQGEISGFSDDWTEVQFLLAAGYHTVSWRYSKDEEDGNGDDCGWVDVSALLPFQTSTTRSCTMADLFPDAFADVRTVTVAEGSKTLGQGFFAGCAALAAVTVPASVECVETATFADCTRLKTATVRRKDYSPDAFPAGCEIVYDISYAVSFDLGGHGRRTGGGELEQTVRHGAAATAPVVAPDDGWRQTGWDASFASVTDDLTVRAVWQRVTWTVQVTNPDGSVTTLDLEHGAEREFVAPEATVDEAGTRQIVVLGTSLTAPAVTNRVKVTVTNALAFAWDVLQTNYWFATCACADGTVLSDGHEGWNPAGSTFVATAVPDETFEFVEWTGDLDGCAADGPSLAVTMDRARTVGATFAKPVRRETRAPAISPAGGLFESESQLVTIACATPDATIYYTLDGTEPSAQNGTVYTGPFKVARSGPVKALATRSGWLDSAVVTVTFTRGDPLSEALDCLDVQVLNDAERPWTVDTAESHDGLSSICSVSRQAGSSEVGIVVRGRGQLSFWWKADCEAPWLGEYYASGSFWVGDNEAARIAGDTGWCHFVTNFTDSARRILRWKYDKRDAYSVGRDRIWVDQLTWLPADDAGQTQTTPVPVPYAWLESHGLGQTADFETAALAKTGKRSASGHEQAVWEDFVAGTDPTDLESVLRAEIDLSSGKPRITWTPDLNKGLATPVRVYRVWGAQTPDGQWSQVDGDAERYRFFRVTVEMP